MRILSGYRAVISNIHWLTQSQKPGEVTSFLILNPLLAWISTLLMSTPRSKPTWRCIRKAILSAKKKSLSSKDILIPGILGLSKALILCSLVSAKKILDVIVWLLIVGGIGWLFYGCYQLIDLFFLRG